MATTHKVITRGLGLLSVAALGALTIMSPASAATPVAGLLSAQSVPTASGLNVKEINVGYYINVAREKHGLKPLASAPCPDYYAEHLAARLESSSTLVHQSLAHIADVCHDTLVGENIARGPMTSSGIVNAWMDSAPHRANILNPNFNQMGVGIKWTSTYTFTTVVDFARH